MYTEINIFSYTVCTIMNSITQRTVVTVQPQVSQMRLIRNKTTAPTHLLIIRQHWHPIWPAVSGPVEDINTAINLLHQHHPLLHHYKLLCGKTSEITLSQVTFTLAF